MQAKEEKQRSNYVDIKTFSRKILSEERAHYEKLIEEVPDQAEFFKRKLAKVEFDEWVLDKKKGEKRVQLLVWLTN